MNRIFDIADRECMAFADFYRTTKGFAKAFRREFDKIVVYHATKITQYESEAILAEGMKRTTTMSLYEKAINRFILPTDLSEQKEAIFSVIDDYFEKNRFITVGEINFSIDRKLLVGHCYYYLLFGPESLLRVAAKLREELNMNFRQQLVNFGSPVIVSALVPVNLTHDIWLERL